MAQRVVRANVAQSSEVLEELAQLRQELKIPDSYPSEAVAAIQPVSIDKYPDHRDIPFVTIDPPGSRDLDQAIHLERENDGYVVRYAISAVGLYVAPGGPLDQEVQRRGVTFYGPDGSIPLHPEELAAGEASLLPGEDRVAYLWYLHLNADGSLRHTWLELVQVRSVAQLTYEQVQDAIDGGTPLPDEVPADFVELIEEVGKARIEQEIARGGVSLDLPEQLIEPTNGGYHLQYRAVTDIEEWNAQISLLTGMAAANLMVDANLGILRTLPPARDKDVSRLRRVARALDIEWDREMSYPDFVRTLDSTIPAHAAFMNEATTLFRGASYLPLGVEIDDPDDEGGDRVTEESWEHSAIAAPYAHVTAPLRRLVDRYGLELCRCLCADEPIPGWIYDALPELPRIMAKASRRSNEYERGAISILEGLVLRGREGEEFSGVVIEADSGRRAQKTGGRGVVMIADPAVEADIRGENLPVGEDVTVVLTGITERGPQFELAGIAEGAAE